MEERYFGLGTKLVTAVAFRREVYLAVIITCLQRFESHILKFLVVFLCSFSVDKFSFCDKINIILWEKNLEKTLSKDQIHLGRN